MSKHSSSADKQGYWVVATCLADILLSVTLLFFGGYGAALCGLLCAALAIGSASYSMLVIPSLMLSIYGLQKGILILKELWPWTEPYESYSQSTSCVFTGMAFVMLFISIFIAIASICAAIRTSAHTKDAAAAATNSSRPRESRVVQPQVIVSEYHPQQPAQLVSHQVPPNTILLTSGGGGADYATTSGGGVATLGAPTTTTTLSPIPLGNAVTTVPVVQRTPSGNIYTEEGILYSGPDGKPTVFSHTTHRASPTTFNQPPPPPPPPHIIVTSPPAAAPLQQPTIITSDQPARAHVQVTVTPHD